MIRSPRHRGVCLPVLLAVVVVTGCVSRGTPPPGSTRSSAPSLPSSPPASPASGPPTTLPAAKPAVAAAIPARLGGDTTGRGAASPQCLAQIETFAEQYSGNRVMLGQAAFADSDRLVLTRTPRRNTDRALLDGRAAAEDPVVLSLLAGPQGCSVQLAAAPLQQPASESSPRAAAVTTAVASPASAPSTALPACTCVPLSR